MFHVEHKPLHNPSQPLPFIPSQGRGRDMGQANYTVCILQKQNADGLADLNEYCFT